MSTPPPGDKDVLGNLPRSRPGRSTARREAARAKRTATPTTNGTKPPAKPRAATAPPKPATIVASAAPAPEPVTAKPAAAKPERAARIPVPVAKAANSEGRAKALKAPRKAAVTMKPKRAPAAKPAGDAAVPAAGWAVPGDGHGTADPAGSLVKLADLGAGILRSIVSRLPG